MVRLDLLLPVVCVALRVLRVLPVRCVLPVVGVHHRVAPSARDQPAVHRPGDEERDAEGERQREPEQRGVEPGRHRPAHDEHDPVVDDRGYLAAYSARL
jgi:hypothetical protein